MALQVHGQERCVRSPMEVAIDTIPKVRPRTERRNRRYDKQIETLATDAYPHTALLRQVNGVGALTAQ
jgi:hypothetical protein